MTNIIKGYNKKVKLKPRDQLLPSNGNNETNSPMEDNY